MGCPFSKSKGKEIVLERNEAARGVNKLSFECIKMKHGVEKENYMICKLNEKECIRGPKTVNGEQLLIENCCKSAIYVLDCAGTVTVDDCTNCTIIVAAVQGSVYLRNCKDTICITSCSQFRIRDCQKCIIFIHSETQPIIESSTGIKFGNLGLSYNGLQEQQQRVGLNTSKISWTEVYDFTPVPGELNWKFLENMEDSGIESDHKLAESYYSSERSHQLLNFNVDKKFDESNRQYFFPSNASKKPTSTHNLISFQRLPVPAKINADNKLVQWDTDTDESEEDVHSFRPTSKLSSGMSANRLNIEELHLSSADEDDLNLLPPPPPPSYFLCCSRFEKCTIS